MRGKRKLKVHWVNGVEEEKKKTKNKPNHTKEDVDEKKKAQRRADKYRRRPRVRGKNYEL